LILISLEKADNGNLKIGVKEKYTVVPSPTQNKRAQVTLRLMGTRI